MATMTEKQAQYRQSLIDRQLAGVVRGWTTKGAEDRQRGVCQAALILAMPTPSTTAEASAQIDALKGIVIRDLARIYGEAWAQGVIDGLMARHGGQLPMPVSQWGEAAEPSVAELVAAVQS